MSEDNKNSEASGTRDSDDATRLQPRNDNTPAAPEDDERTRIARPAQAQPQASTDDSTRIVGQPQSSSDDETRVFERPGQIENKVDKDIGAGTPSKDAPLTENAPLTMSATRTTSGGTRYKAVELPAGEVIKDRFVLRELLGVGGMGMVYRAIDIRKQEAEDEHAYIAIKILGEEFQRHPHAFIALQREAKKTQALAHPNIITVYDFDRDGDSVFITMEELTGKPLDTHLKHGSLAELSDAQLWDIIQQIASGLAYAHSRGLVHSDLKPGNIFYTDDHRVKILDFGIARIANEEMYQDSFDAGDLGALTPRYASLEMFNYQDPHPSDDIYALGIIACELLAGQHPYKNQEATRAFEEGWQPELPRIRNPFLASLVKDAVALERSKRIADAQTFLKRLEFARKGPKRLAILAGIAVIVAVANFAYLQTLPDAVEPFENLPPEAQQAFHERIDEAMSARALGKMTFNDWVVYFNQAYRIHPKNKDIEEGMEWMVDMFEESLENSNGRSFVYANLKLFRERPEEFPAFQENEKLDELWQEVQP